MVLVTVIAAIGDLQICKFKVWFFPSLFCYLVSMTSKEVVCLEGKVGKLQRFNPHFFPDGPDLPVGSGLEVSFPQMTWSGRLGFCCHFSVFAIAGN